jgi:hypothetical protein
MVEAMFVLTVTSRSWWGRSYWRITVNESSISLSMPRRTLRKLVTDLGWPKRRRAWSIVWLPADLR